MKAQSESDVEQLIAQWRTSTGLQNDDLFSLRLDAEHLTRAELAEWLQRLDREDADATSPAAPLSFPPPNKPAEASAYISACQHPLPWTEAEESLTPFLTLVEPWLHPAQVRIWETLQLMEARHPGAVMSERLFQSARHALRSACLHWTSQIGMVELHLARTQGQLSGDTDKQRFEYFIAWLGSDDGRRQLLTVYPCLANIIQCRIRQTTNFVLEVLDRYVQDRHTLGGIAGLSSPLPALCRIQPGRGDRHDDGRTVAILDFAGNGDGNEARLVYKPRPLAMEAAWAKLLDWMTRRGIGPDQRAAAVLLQEQYGYMEHVPFQDLPSSSAAKRFVERLGGLTALTYLLSATDMHYENLIAFGEYPVLIDLETLMHPMESLSGHQSVVQDSVLCSTLLPEWTQQLRAGAMDVSGFAIQPEKVPARVPVNPGTDTLSFSASTLALPLWHNLPRLEGHRLLPADHLDALVQGFDATYQGLMKHRGELMAPDGPLSAFRGLPARVLYRGTEVYNNLLNAFTHPDLLKTELARERVLERLWRKAQHHPELAPMVREERRSLRQCDVPRFPIRTDEVVLRSPGDEPLAPAFATSGYQEAVRRLNRMSEQDQARQRRILTQSVVTMTSQQQRIVWPRTRYRSKARAKAVDSSNAMSKQMIELARTLGDEILETALGSDDDRVFLQIQPGSAGGASSLRPIGWTLYNGLIGMALFFAQLARLTGHHTYEAAARSMLEDARTALHRSGEETSIGAFSGLAGWTYALAYLGRLWRDPSLVEQSLTSLDQLLDRLPEDQQLDLIGGAAGALLVSIRLHRVTSDERAILTAQRLGAHLLNHAVETPSGIGWHTSGYPDLALTGFGHGASGFALGLAWLGELTDSPACKDAAQQALNHEHATFNPATGIFADLREDRRETQEQPGHVYAWCHGAPGMGLARLHLPESYRDRQWSDTVNSTIRATLDEGMGASHCLCHGDLGNLDLMLNAEGVDDPGIKMPPWRHLIPQLVDRIREHPRGGAFREAALIDLMLGSSGIGYGLLRMAQPQMVPSVLALELPQS